MKIVAAFKQWWYSWGWIALKPEDVMKRGDRLYDDLGFSLVVTGLAGWKVGNKVYDIRRVTRHRPLRYFVLYVYYSYMLGLHMNMAGEFYRYGGFQRLRHELVAEGYKVKLERLKNGNR